MFASSVRHLNNTYIQNNFYGSGNSGYNTGMYVSPMCCNSVFAAGMPCGNPSTLSMWGGPMSMPNMQCGGWFSPFLGFYNQCGNRFFDMLMSFRLLQSGLDALTNIFDTLSGRTSNNSQSPQYFMPQMTYTPAYPTFMFSTITPSIKPQTANSRSTLTNSNSVSNIGVNSNTNLPQLNSVGYNPDKGRKLAEAVLSNEHGFHGECAMYVRIALEKTGLYNGLRGDGADYVNILSQNKNFKEISTAGLNLRSLPAGCILVYERGVAGYSSSAGHVEITTGTGKAVSDGITNNIRAGAHVFVPV